MWLVDSRLNVTPSPRSGVWLGELKIWREKRVWSDKRVWSPESSLSLGVMPPEPKAGLAHVFLPGT